MSVKNISPSEVFHLHQESGGITIIDVREPDEFAQISAPVADNLPLSRFDANNFAKNHDKKSQVFVLCRSGNRSMVAAQMLANVGFECVYNVKGGMNDWEASGLPIVRGGSRAMNI